MFQDTRPAMLLDQDQHERMAARLADLFGNMENPEQAGRVLLAALESDAFAKLAERAFEFVQSNED